MHSNEQPKLLFVISDLAIGGTERQLAVLAPELVRLGWAVSVYSFADGEVLRRQVEQGGVAVIVVPGKRGLLHASKIIRALSASLGVSHLFWVMLTLRPQIVHCFLPAA